MFMLRTSFLMDGLGGVKLVILLQSEDILGALEPTGSIRPLSRSRSSSDLLPFYIWRHWPRAL